MVRAEPGMLPPAIRIRPGDYPNQYGNPHLRGPARAQVCVDSGYVHIRLGHNGGMFQIRAKLHCDIRCNIHFARRYSLAFPSHPIKVRLFCYAGTIRTKPLVDSRHKARPNPRRTPKASGLLPQSCPYRGTVAGR